MKNAARCNAPQGATIISQAGLPANPTKSVAAGYPGRKRGLESPRRVVRVDLSEEGKKLNRKFLEHRRKISKAMLSPLTHGEREIFIELMSKIASPPSIIR